MIRQPKVLSNNTLILHLEEKRKKLPPKTAGTTKRWGSYLVISYSQLIIGIVVWKVEPHVFDFSVQARKVSGQRVKIV